MTEMVERLENDDSGRAGEVGIARQLRKFRWKEKIGDAIWLVERIWVRPNERS